MLDVEPAARSMPSARSSRARIWIALPPLGALSAISIGSAGADTGNRVTVPQRGRTFAPGSAAIRKDDTLDIVNDDGDIVHRVQRKARKG